MVAPHCLLTRSCALQVIFQLVFQERSYCKEKTSYSVSERREPGLACATIYRLSVGDRACARAHVMRDNCMRAPMMTSPMCAHATAARGCNCCMHLCQRRKEGSTAVAIAVRHAELNAHQQPAARYAGSLVSWFEKITTTGCSQNLTTAALRIATMCSVRPSSSTLRRPRVLRKPGNI